MVWPLPSSRPDRLIETPAAWPVTTTWKASNSFFAAAILATAAAPAGACAEGRIFWAAGATQTWAADADPAASKATNRGSVFTLSLLGWLLPGTAGVPRSGWPTQGACRLLHGRCAAPCPKPCVYRGIGVLRGRRPTSQQMRPRTPYNASERPEARPCAGVDASRSSRGRVVCGRDEPASESQIATPRTEGGATRGPSTPVRAHSDSAGERLLACLAVDLEGLSRG